MEVTFETEVSVAVRAAPQVTQACWCGGVLLTPDAAALVAAISLRAVYRLIEADAVHYTDEREPRVCSKSLLRAAPASAFR
jgi:hypothetical protein